MGHSSELIGGNNMSRLACESVRLIVAWNKLMEMHDDGARHVLDLRRYEADMRAPVGLRHSFRIRC